MGSNAQEIIDNAYEWLSDEYWRAIEMEGEPKVDLIGMSRGGFIASEIAWKVKRAGYVNRPEGVSTNFAKEIRFLGMYDPVDQSNVAVTRSVSDIVSLSAVGVATNFAGNTTNEVSRYYWDRISYANADLVKTFSATHSGFQGAPTYSTDGGQLVGPIPVPGHPSTWLEGYTDALDKQGSIAVDRWFREHAKSVSVPIDSIQDYDFDSLYPNPNR